MEGCSHLSSKEFIFFLRICCRDWDSALSEIRRLFIGSAPPPKLGGKP